MTVRPTIADLNARISDLNLIAAKHPDYFWFGHGEGEDLSASIPESVCVRRFADLTLDQWERHVRDAQPAPEVAAQTEADAAPETQPKAKAHKPRAISLAPKKQARACKAGTKQALLVDLLSRAGGASMAELREALAPWKDVTIKSGLSWDMNAIKGYGIRTTFETGYQRWLATDYAGQGTFRADSHPDDVSEADRAALLADNLANGYDPDEIFAVYHLVLPEGMAAPVPHDAKRDPVAAIKEWATANFAKSYGASALAECFTDEELRSEFKNLGEAKRWAKLQSEQHASAAAEAAE